MAPSRKRKAAAAAAARRQWKVGDLVLAKLKGFPAWPAMISEPEKWGFNADRKKVLVLFFGTQQIAFCNPVDIEAFTEEKKQSLLKRQGRGADFVRAVKEIVDSYEKSKKQDEVYGSNSSYEDAIPDGGNSAESAAHIEVKEAAETSEVTVTGKTLSTCFAKRRSGALEPSKQVKPRLELVIDKSSISSCSESLKCLKTSLKDSSKCPGNVPTDVVQNGCLRRSRHNRKSPNTSECDDVDSSGFVMTGSTDENDSEIFPSDSASFSLNDGCTIDSDCKPDCSEAPIESWDGDVESKGLDFQIKAVVVKKKRKLGRKRPTNEAAELLGRLERDMELVVGPNNSANVAETACRTFDETHNKDDGDKHLPLVKRARVRMSKLSSCEEHDIPSQDELTCKEVAVNMQDHQYNSCEEEERTNIEASVFKLEATNPSAISQDDCPAFKSSFSPREVSPLSACVSSPDDTKILTTKESEAFGCSTDGEAALPPSKRLHRALEAMSANVAKDGEACKSSTKKASVSDCSVFPMMSPSNIGTKNEDICGSGEKNYDGDKVSTFCSSSDVILKDSIKAPVELDVCNQAMEGKEHCCYVSPDAVENNGGNELSEPWLKAQVVGASRDLIQVNVTHHLDGRQTNLPADLDSSGQSLQMDEKKHTSTFSTDLADENVYREVDLSELTGTTPSLVSRGCEAVKDISERGINLLECIRVDSSLPNAECLRFQIGDSRQTNGELDIMTENRIERRHEDASHVSISDRHIADKDVLAFQPTLFPADAVESPRRTSPTTASLCQVSTSESANDVHNSGCSSPSAHLNYKKSVCSSLTDEEKTESTIPQLPKYSGKWGNFAEMRTALASFEAVLGSLTRTKESIARATRIAVDCTKFSASAEVIEILARNLEKESTLHKRIDLFFLVDSIAQCSRGSKGDIGGMYPSAIQSALPRLLSAAAPLGSGAHENRRQCLKVLRLWLERKILPESVIRQHIRELDALGGSSSAGPYARRSARRERALDDPIRDMEGMLVDEYGSNSSLQLAGLCMPRMLKDEEEEEEEEKGDSDSDGDGFEAVTPEHNSGSPQDQETSLATEKHTHLLEDVDGELEMEDAAPSEVQIRSTSGSTGVSATQNLYGQSGQSFSLPFVPLMPQEMPPASSSPPPPPPPLPPLPPPPPLPPTAPVSCLVSSSYANGLDVRPYPVSQNAHEDFLPSGVHLLDPPKIHQCMSNAEQNHASECRDRMQMQLCDSTGSSSGSYASSQDYGEHFGGPRFHHEAHHPRPPHPPPSDHFAYIQPRLYGKSRRDTPPHPYSRRSSHNSDGGSFYNSHERMRPAPYEFEEGWRHHMPHFHGPHYQDNKPFHPPGPYRGHPREPVRFPRQVWADSPREMHHRDFPPFRPSSEAQCIWRPR